MANTYSLISSNTFTSSATTITFSSIPATYTDLLVRVSARTDAATVTDSIFSVRLNADATTLYSDTLAYGTGAAAASSRRSATATMYNGTQPAAGAVSNTFGNAEIYFPSYTASQSKVISTFSASESNVANATGLFWNGVDAGLYRSNTAISSITIGAYVSGANFISGSSFYLYGIKST